MCRRACMCKTARREWFFFVQEKKLVSKFQKYSFATSRKQTQIFKVTCIHRKHSFLYYTILTVTECLTEEQIAPCLRVPWFCVAVTSSVCVSLVSALSTTMSIVRSMHFTAVSSHNNMQSKHCNFNRHQQTATPD